MSVNKGKAIKILSQSFIDNHAEITEDDASALIVKCEQQIRELKDEMSADPKLIAARQIVKDLSAGYNGAVRHEKAKIAFMLDKIEEIVEESSKRQAIKE